MKRFSRLRKTDRWTFSRDSWLNVPKSTLLNSISQRSDIMIVGEGTGSFNPNHSWLNAKGTWATYIVITLILHLLFFVNPWLNAAWAWTLTNTIHNLGNFLLLHMTKGTPWMPMDEGKARYLTQWEQLDHGMQFTATKKFLTVIPIVLFFLASFFSKYDPNHFVLNAFTLLLVILPKMPQFHGVRLFGINKYWLWHWTKKMCLSSLTTCFPL